MSTILENSGIDIGLVLVLLILIVIICVFQAKMLSDNKERAVKA